MDVLPITGSELNDLLPQRFPFLLLDKITDYSSGEWASGCKNIAAREPLLVPESTAYWPESFVIESLGQLAIALLNLKRSEKPLQKILLGGLTGVTFHQRVPMGCRLELFIKVEKYVENEFFIVSGHADLKDRRIVTMESLIGKFLSEASAQS